MQAKKTMCRKPIRECLYRHPAICREEGCEEGRCKKVHLEGMDIEGWKRHGGIPYKMEEGTKDRGKEECWYFTGEKGYCFQGPKCKYRHDNPIIEGTVYKRRMTEEEKDRMRNKPTMGGYGEIGEARSLETTERANYRRDEDDELMKEVYEAVKDRIIDEDMEVDQE